MQNASHQPETVYPTLSFRRQMSFLGGPPRFWPRIRVIATVVAVLGYMAIPGDSISQAAQLHVTFDASGHPSIRIDGLDLTVKPGQFPGPAVRMAETASSEGQKPTLDQKPVSSSFDSERRQLTTEFRWGRMIRTWRVAGDRIDCDIEVHNTCATELSEVTVPIVSLLLPAGSQPARVSEATYFGQTVPAMSMNTMTGPAVLPMLVGEQALVACTSEALRPLELRWEKAPPRKSAAESDLELWHLKLQAGGDRLLWHEVRTTRPVPPGAKDQYQVSLRLGAGTDPLAPAEDVCRAYAKTHPLLLKWPDRRPILRVFIGDWFPMRAPAGPALQRPPGPVQVSNEFRTRVMRSADQLLADLKHVDAQGMILWNVEGGNDPHIKYVGDPQMVEFMCPEMDAIADEYFRKLREGGCRPGLCLRPSTIAVQRQEDGSYAYRHTYPPDRSAVDVLSQKAAYAKKRWGCTLFYVDTNDVWGPPKPPDTKPYHALMNADQWNELLRRHPDVLFIPEHGYLRYYTSSAGYDQMDMGLGAGAGVTPELVRRTWPGAFKCLTVDWPMARSWDKTVQAFVQGDVLLSNTPTEGGGLLISEARAEAALIAEGPPADLPREDPGRLAALAADARAARRLRYFASFELGKLSQAQAKDRFLGLLAADDWLVRKNAVLGLGGTGDASVVEVLITVASDPASNLVGFVEQAMGRLGEPSVAPLEAKIALGQSQPSRLSSALMAVRFLGAVKHPSATAALARLLGSEQSHLQVRQTAAFLLSRREREPEAVAALSAALAQPAVRVSVANHLRYTRERAIVAALKAALEREKATSQPDRKFVEALEMSIRGR